MKAGLDGKKDRHYVLLSLYNYNAEIDNVVFMSKVLVKNFEAGINYFISKKKIETERELEVVFRLLKKSLVDAPETSFI